MSEWKEALLGDIAIFVNGRAYLQPELQDQGKYKIVRVGNLSGGDKWFFSDMELDNNKYCYKGDLLYAWACTFGPYIWNSDKTIFHYHIWKIIEDTACVDRMFLYYLLTYQTPKMLGNVNGSVMMHITKSSIEKTKVLIPTAILTQRRIAAILSSLDAKIENNNKVNAKLEEIAQNLFKEWFVDFGPFKDGKFVDSELGPIPEGWRVGSVYEYVNVVYGAPYKSDKFNENGLGLPLIRIRDLKTNKPQVSTEEILPQTEYVEAGDIVAGMDAEFIPFIWKGEKGLLNQRVCKLKPQVVGIDDLFVMYLMLPHLIFTQSYKVGTTVSHIGKSDFDKFVSVLPPLDIVLHFSEKIAPMRSEIVRLSKETRELATLRDTLLPKLMSGEIEV